MTAEGFDRTAVAFSSSSSFYGLVCAPSRVLSSFFCVAGWRFDLDDCKEHNELDDDLFPRSTFGGYEDDNRPCGGGGGGGSSSESGDDHGDTIEVGIERGGEAVGGVSGREAAGKGGGQRAAAPGQPDTVAELTGASWRMQAKKRMWSTMKGHANSAPGQHLPLGPSLARSASSGSDLLGRSEGRFEEDLERHVPDSHSHGRPEASQHGIDLTAEPRAPFDGPFDGRPPATSSSRLEAALSRAAADAPSLPSDAMRPNAQSQRGAWGGGQVTGGRASQSARRDESTPLAHAETEVGTGNRTRVEEIMEEVVEEIGEDETGDVQMTSVGEAPLEEDEISEDEISESSGAVEIGPSVEVRQEAGQGVRQEARQEVRQETRHEVEGHDVEGHDNRREARAGAEGGHALTALSDEELAELRLRAPAGFTTDELRYMLAQSVADC